MMPPCFGGHDPLRTMHEPKMLGEVLLDIREAGEWSSMPETAMAPALEQPLLDNLCHSEI